LEDNFFTQQETAFAKPLSAGFQYVSNGYETYYTGLKSKVSHFMWVLLVSLALQQCNMTAAVCGLTQQFIFYK
jgi:hypothetical protein